MIYAKAPHANGEVRKFIGPIIEAPSFKLAEEYCQLNGLGYCYIDGELIAEIDAKTGDEIDHEKPNLN